MKKAFSLYIALTISFLASAQGNGDAYFFYPQQNSISLNFKKIDNFYERLYLLYSLTVDDRFLVTNSDDDCVFFITCDDENLSGSLFEDTFINFMEEKTEEFGSFDKKAVAMSEASWKNNIPDSFMLSMMMDYITAGSPRADNDSCYKAEPFCTDYGLYTFSAMAGDGHFAESGPSYSCLDQQPCPSWYYMKISTPGAFTIHIEGYDGDTSRDVDFCCWGPFDDPMSPCPNGLTEEKVTDCSYSGTHTEDCHIPATALGGEYYIMVITNYSKTTCIITFEKSEGSGPGTTDCSIMPPAIDYSGSCYGDTLHLTAQDVHLASYTWSGPDGFTSHIREPFIPNVTMANSGTYECSIAIPEQGTSDPMTIDVEILPQLHADFVNDKSCVGEPVQFTGTETTTPANNNDKITSYSWDFGDGESSDEQSPTHTYDVTGTYDVTYTIAAENEHGDRCEDIIVRSITISTEDNTTINASICLGEDYHGFGFDTIGPATGTHILEQSLTTAAGCDSLVTLNLTVNEFFDINIEDTTCYGDGYHQHGFDIYDLEQGLNYSTLYLQSDAGCDSTVTLELYVAPNNETDLFDTICYGNDYHGHNFDIISPEPGLNIMQQQLTTTMGCDSTVTLELYVIQHYDTRLFDTICHGDDYHGYNFDTINPATGLNVMQQQLATASGCDSIVTMSLYVGERYDLSINDTICQGDNYNEYNFHIGGQNPGTQSAVQSLSSAHGCDSTVRLDLFVAPTYLSYVFDSVCEGETYTGYGLDTSNFEPGMHDITSVLKTPYGCDSVFDLRLKVFNKLVFPAGIQGMDYVLVATDINTGIYNYHIDPIPGCDEYRWAIKGSRWAITPDGNECRILVTSPGTATLSVSVNNECGDVTQSLDIKAGYYDIPEDESLDVNIYPNPCQDEITVEGDKIEEINVISTTGIVVRKKKYDMEDKVVVELDGLPNSVYIVETTTANGRSLKRITVTNN